MQTRRQVLGLLAGLPLVPAFSALAYAAKPEDVFKAKIIITKNRLPTKFASAGAFISAVQNARIDKIWPASEEGNDKAT